MHSISPYTIRVSNKNSRGKDKYIDLHEINLLDRLFSFVSSNNGVMKDEDTKQTYVFSDINHEPQNNKIYGWFMVGSHGMASAIVNSNTGATDYNKTVHHADLIKHYFQFYLRKD